MEKSIDTCLVEKNPMKDLGNRIRFERKAIGLTLQNFAKLVGTSSSMLQRVETGAKSPSVELLVEIANICRKPIDDLLKQQLNGFKKFNAKNQKSFQTKDFEIKIICPYGLISKDIAISHFKGKTGAIITPPTQKGYIWVYILKGKGVFEYEEISRKVRKGDTLYYDSEKKHCLKILSTLESIRVNIGK
jgi:transcriptional regulator with XRE-family HTH domain